MKTRIAISSGWEPGQLVEGWPLVYTCKGVVEKVEQNGSLPFVLPVVENLDLCDSLLDGMDLLILSGEVLSIKRNVLEEHETNVLRSSNPLRYDNETALLRSAMKTGIPVLGICRGFQVMAAELGGEVQDEDVNEGNFIIHQQGKIAPPVKAVHSVRIAEGSLLGKLCEAEGAMVNSFHRQAVRKIPPGFRACALSDDGTIEAMESTSNYLALGTQFHPEILPSRTWDTFFKNLFALLGESRNARR